MFIRTMCECLVCLAKKSGREFSEFANTWVRDNIQYRKPEEKLTIKGEIPDRWRRLYAVKQPQQERREYGVCERPNTAFVKGQHLDVSLRHDEWDERTTREVEERQDRAEADALLGRRPVDLATRHSSPQGDGARSSKKGRKLTTYREHEVSVSWQPNTKTRPPSVSGAFSSWQMSPKTRRRILNAGKWLTAKHPHGAFLTLTYDRPVCDTVAKQHLDRFLKRFHRSVYGNPAVLWAAERTKRHYIHFHVIVGGWIDKDWLQDAWRGSTGLTLYTNVKKITRLTAPYIVKYVGKHDRAYIFGRRWGQSKYVANGAAPNWRGECVECDWDEFCKTNDLDSLDPNRVTFTRSGYLYEMKVTSAKRKWLPNWGENII